MEPITKIVHHVGGVLLHSRDIHCSAQEFLVVRLVRFPRSSLIPLHHGEVFLPRVLERTPHGHEGNGGAAVDEQKDRVVHVLAAHFDPLLNSADLNSFEAVDSTR